MKSTGAKNARQDTRKNVGAMPLTKVCDKWLPIVLRHGDGTMWWCRHNIGIMEHHLKNRKEVKAFKERHANRVQSSEEYMCLAGICNSFRFRDNVNNPGPGWYCEHGFTISTITKLALDNLVGWHYNYTKDKEAL